MTRHDENWTVLQMLVWSHERKRMALHDREICVYQIGMLSNIIITIFILTPQPIS